MLSASSESSQFTVTVLNPLVIYSELDEMTAGSVSGG